MLERERNALVGLVDLEHFRLDIVALLQHFGRMVDLLRPRQVGDVDHAIDAFFELNKRAVSGEVADLALDAGAGRVLARDDFPRIGIELADAEGNLLVFLADAEHNGFDFLALREDVGGTRDALGPAELGDVDEAFDARFQFHERAVRHEVRDLALDLHVHRILLGDLVPRIHRLLLQAERHALFLAVDIEHEHFDFLAHLEHFARVVEAAPAHVGDVEQAVEAVEVDERTEVGDVLDRALDRAALFDATEQLRALLGAFGFDQLAARQNDVLALFVELNNFALEGLALVNAEIFRRDDVNLEPGRNASTPTLSMRPPLTTALTLPVMRPPLLKICDDLFPVLLLGRFFLGKDNHALIVLEALEQHFDFGADFQDFAVLKFAEADDTLGLVADVDEDFIGAFLQDASLDDTAFGKRLHRFP